MIYITLFLIITLFTIVSLFVYEVYKSNEDLIASWADALRQNKLIIDWLIFICDSIIVASQGIITISLIGIGIVFATSIGLHLHLAAHDIFMQSADILIFITFYAFALSSVFFVLKRKLEKR